MHRPGSWIGPRSSGVGTVELSSRLHRSILRANPTPTFVAEMGVVVRRPLRQMQVSFLGNRVSRLLVLDTIGGPRIGRCW